MIVCRNSDPEINMDEYEIVGKGNYEALYIVFYCKKSNVCKFSYTAVYV